MVTEMDYVTGIGEVGLSSVTHMNLFWVKDLNLGKVICMGGMGGPWISLSPHTQ